MTVLSFQVENVGQAGQVPKFVYINTNNTVGEVTTLGYLNHFIAEGNQVTDSEMVLISTKPTPSSKTVQNILCVVTFVGGSCKLTQYGSSAVSSAWLLGGNPQAGPQVLSAADDVTLQSSLGSINLLAPNPGEAANIVSSIVNIDGSNTLALSSATQVDITSGGPLALTSVAGSIAFDAAVSYLFDSVPAAVTPNVIYYNTASGAITYGAAGGGGGGGFTWSSVNGGPQALVAANGYVADNAGLQSFSLPAVAAVGDEFRVIGQGAGGWTITQGAGQHVQVGATASAVGAGGSVSSGVSQFDNIWLVCTVANTTFSAHPAPVGNLNIV